MCATLLRRSGSLINIISICDRVASHTHSASLPRSRRSNSKMGSMVGEKAEEAMSNKLWKESKISWVKYKCYKTYKTVKAGECCA